MNKNNELVDFGDIADIIASLFKDAEVVVEKVDPSPKSTDSISSRYYNMYKNALEVEKLEKVLKFNKETLKTLTASIAEIEDRIASLKSNLV